MSLDNVILVNQITSIDRDIPIIKIIDFGLCRYFPNHAANDYTCTLYGGKLSYMSPEVEACEGAKGRRSYDASKADIW